MDKQKVLITGAFGTWGTEFTKQLLELGHTIIGVGRDEKAAADYARKFPDVEIMVTDYVNVDFDGLGVDTLIHGAAYKHINLCEVNIDSAIENNITKTIPLYKSAQRNNVKICYISTDKAVAPYSVYGMTKAIAERMTWSYGGLVARSGNIMGSNGSVVHVWRECVKNNKPLTVTDMGMERYFIKVEDAVRLSWEGFENNAPLTLVDIGGKLKLGDIINKVLEEFGHTIDTYDPGIKIIGLREGVERLSDDITWEFDNKYL